ncbi:hypothetical protein [Verminephrobacter eiseniae]|uniref:hypothetical protein n=1 Tax=Verminephrobacter eiseniae TaxID=364317 RepID=UPI0012ECE000|nr:hypothetical protein [Verminephrobacter eiseniae]MCW5286537.1 hypothetical protein [Verminephrobacter eiseniae]MCW5304836.1 hypothetical protein [Verminephrobacter eiseniae]
MSRHRSSVGLRWPSKRIAALHRLPIQLGMGKRCALRCAPMAARSLRHLIGDATLGRRAEPFQGSDSGDHSAATSPAAQECRSGGSTKTQATAPAARWPTPRCCCHAELAGGYLPHHPPAWRPGRVPGRWCRSVPVSTKSRTNGHPTPARRWTAASSPRRRAH